MYNLSVVSFTCKKEVPLTGICNRLCGYLTSYSKEYIGDIFALLYSVLGRYTNTLNHTGIISPRTVLTGVKKAEHEKERRVIAFKDNFFVEVEFTLTLTTDVCHIGLSLGLVQFQFFKEHLRCFHMVVFLWLE